MVKCRPPISTCAKTSTAHWLASPQSSDQGSSPRLPRRGAILQHLEAHDESFPFRPSILPSPCTTALHHLPDSLETDKLPKNSHPVSPHQPRRHRALPESNPNESPQTRRLSTFPAPPNRVSKLQNRSTLPPHNTCQQNRTPIDSAAPRKSPPNSAAGRLPALPCTFKKAVILRDSQRGARQSARAPPTPNRT